MIVLVSGAASSGKSAWAERTALLLSKPHYYAATMAAAGAEAQARIARHVAMRAGKGFTTLELAEGDSLPKDRCGTLLLEDMGNVVVNSLEAMLDEVLKWDNAVVVTNDVGADGVSYEGFTDTFIKQVGLLSAHIAARADAVVEVVAGIPVFVKGEATLMPALEGKPNA